MQVTRVQTERDPSNYGDAVSNAIFHVARGHWLAERAVEGFAEAFRGNVWASGGPNLVQSLSDIVTVPRDQGKIVTMSNKYANK